MATGPQFARYRLCRAFQPVPDSGLWGCFQPGARVNCVPAVWVHPGSEGDTGTCSGRAQPQGRMAGSQGVWTVSAGGFCRTISYSAWMNTPAPPQPPSPCMEVCVHQGPQRAPRAAEAGGSASHGKVDSGTRR